MSNSNSSGHNLGSPFHSLFVMASALALAAWLTKPESAAAQAVTINSVSPNNGASGVSASAPVIFTFSVPMNTGSAVIFSNLTASAIIPAIPAWSAGNTVVTYTPIGNWPANSTIAWMVFGFSTTFQPLTGTTTGTFSTGSTGSTGIGTNRVSMFELLRANSYNQNGSAAPVLAPDFSYSFFGVANLTSNRTAASVTLTMPTGGISNLISFLPNNNYSMAYGTTNLGAIDALFPSGPYSFSVQGPSSNQTLGLTFPTTAALPQPNAPHLSNYSAAQTINPAQPFTLTWDAFQNGTVTDYVSLVIESQSGPDVFRSPDILLPSALNGTSTAVTIPGGTLQAGSNYLGSLTFFKGILNTNNPDNSTWVVRASSTSFNLATFGVSPLVITNVSASGGNLSFNIRCSPSQVLTILSASNLTTAPWIPRLTTNASGTLVHYSEAITAANASLFYRAKNGTP